MPAYLFCLLLVDLLVVKILRHSAKAVTIMSNSNVRPVLVGTLFMVIVVSVFFGYFGSDLSSFDIFLLYLLPFFFLITHASYEAEFNAYTKKITLIKRYFLGSKVTTVIDVEDFEGVDVDCSRKNFYGRTRGVNLYLSYVHIGKRNPHKCVPITVNGFIGTHSIEALTAYAEEVNALMVGSIKGDKA